MHDLILLIEASINSQLIWFNYELYRLLNYLYEISNYHHGTSIKAFYNSILISHK